MSVRERYPEFPGSGQSRKRQHASSPLSHSRKRFSKWKNQKPGRKDLETLCKLREIKKIDKSRAEPIYATLPKLRPPTYNRTKNRARPTFNFEEDFPTGDDSMEGSLLSNNSDDDTHGYGGPDAGLHWQAQKPSLWPAKGWIPQDERSEDIQDWILGIQERERTQPHLDHVPDKRSPLVQILNQNRTDRYSDFSSRDDYSDRSDNTSLPVIEFEDNELGAAVERDTSPVSVRQPSVVLDTTPQSNRSFNQLGAQLGSAMGDSPIVTGKRPLTINDVEKPQLEKRIQRVQPVRQNQQPRRQTPTDVEESVIGNRQPSPLLDIDPSIDESAQLDELVAYDNQSVHTIESDSSFEHTISDAILDLHQSMSKPFWTNDERWLVSVTLPVSQSRVFTPICDEIIKRATELIQVIEWIKGKDTGQRTRFAIAMNRRMTSAVRKIRVSCNTICHNLPTKSQNDLTAKISGHTQTLKRMREYLIPRLVLVIAKAFTLLANPAPKMRCISMSLMEDICFDMQRIANIIKIGTENNESNISEGTADIKEVIHSLSVVQDWVRTERDRDAD